MSQPWYTVVLLDKNENEISRCDDVTNSTGSRGSLNEAKDRARYLLSEEYALSGETTHAALGTDKVEIRDEDGTVVWDRFYKAPARAVRL